MTKKSVLNVTHTKPKKMESQEVYSATDVIIADIYSKIIEGTENTTIRIYGINTYSASRHTNN